MKIQFELGQFSHQRHFTSILDELERRGHQVVKTASTQDCPGLVKSRIADGDHRSLLAFDAYIRDDEFGPLAYILRAARDYLRYLKQVHVDSLTIKERIRNMLEAGIPQLPNRLGAKLTNALSEFSNDDVSVDRLDLVLSLIEEIIPPHRKIVEFLKAIDADVLCITPYIVTQYGQTDIIKAAMDLSLPIVFMVGSWDNLTSKGAVQVPPDATLVWNEVQREEAFLYHGIPKDRVYLAGAARFDEFWERKIEVDRETYCRLNGLDHTLPVITYLGSSNLISGDEREFVQRWIDGLRDSKLESLLRVNILLRPHPKFAKGWKESFSGQSGVAVVVSNGPVVNALNNDSELFHCLSHSDAVIGANTSAELEAAILNKPVFTIEDEFFCTGQAGTVHFQYLAGPLAKVAKSLTEHYLQLAERLADKTGPFSNDKFVTSFLRPGGLTRPACKVTVDILENIWEQNQGSTARQSLEYSDNYVSGESILNKVKSLFSARTN